MTPANLEIKIYQGATFTEVFRWMSDGNPVNLTGAIITAQVRDEASSPSLILDLSTVNGMITILDAAQGRFKMEIPAATTEDLTFERAVYDIKVELNGYVYPIIAGRAGLVLSPTKKFEND